MVVVLIIIVIVSLSIRAYFHNSADKLEAKFNNRPAIINSPSSDLFKNQKYAIINILAYAQGANAISAYSKEAILIMDRWRIKLGLSESEMKKAIQNSMSLPPERSIKLIINSINEIRDKNFVHSLYRDVKRIAQISRDEETIEFIKELFTDILKCSEDDDEEVTKTIEKVITPSKVDGEINGHAYVELAGLKWATENVGAVSGVEAAAKDATYGYYYTQDNARKAAKSWGGTWSLPSEAQWQALLDECEWEWKEDYSYGGKTMNGYIVSDKYDSSKFIFLPAAGFYDDGNGRVYDYGGYYWSTGNGRFLVFNGGGRFMYSYNPYSGMTVRPVVAEGQSSSTTQTEQSSSTTEIKIPGQINGHAYVELAGLKWATENVGAVSGVEAAAKDATYGYYYTQDNARKAVASWGGAWKLPSEAQWQKLIDECDWRWKEDYYFGGKTMNGYIVSDKYDSSKFIFLPAAGICSNGYGYVREWGYGGSYWSADGESYLTFGGVGRGVFYHDPGSGMAVRPVSE